MTIQEILVGLSYRIDNLSGAIKVLEKDKELKTGYPIDDMEARKDELESVYAWIVENNFEEKV